MDPQPAAARSQSAAARSPNATSPADAHAWFARKLSLETDPADVRAAQKAGKTDFLLIDTRTRQAFEAGHLPGALSLPHAEMDAATTASLPRDALLVTYCWSASCNASTKGALKLSALGFTVKEMIGGIAAWKADGHPIEA